MSSVKEGIAAYTEVENLGEDNKLHCDKCNESSCVKKQTQIWDLPKVLVITLKRFVFSEERGDFEKCDSKVSYER